MLFHFLFGGDDDEHDVRLNDKEYKEMMKKMSPSERRDFERRQKELKRDRENDKLDAWLDFEEDMDDLD